MGIIALAAAIAVFTGIGAGVGISLATGKAVEGIARQPEAAGQIRNVMLLGAVLAEATAIYGLVVALVLVFLKMK
ncbi:ATP synthase F0 subunit C [Clostridium sp. BNL1100]|uniref:ATP synthase F0 subunit C n=1 Tax=Clostridium sp. BNL1100 TaxID=755731 RepID=UPI00024A70EA|nr:ATP synthase F0 subunit C [Clostridium sp. BNL1100]AEY64576.1 ATP synthase, F0 subunit c [Clostridium sp. BNL1100]